jgi:hypothetical protein
MLGKVLPNLVDDPDSKNEILKDLFFIERGYLSGINFVYRSKAPILIDTGYISGFHETEKR